MKDATKSKSEFPKNNWVHTFKYFHDIIDVINNEFKLNTPLEELVLKHNLKIELLENIKTLLSKYGSGIDKSNLWAKFCREKVSNGLDDVSHLPFKYIKWLSMFAWVLPGKQHYLRRHFIEKSISSGIFLRFSRDKNTYEDTEISKYLSVLKDQMERYFRLASFASDQNVKFFEKYDFNKSTPNDQIVPIKNMDILSFLALHDCEEDIINISKAMYQYLGNNINTFENIKLSPRTPFEDENVKIENESLSDDEVITWINEN